VVGVGVGAYAQGDSPCGSTLLSGTVAGSGKVVGAATAYGGTAAAGVRGKSVDGARAAGA
jgi:hypothetical protein